jgi:hypothetical protein
VFLLVNLSLGPYEFVGFVTKLLWYNGLIDSDSKGEDPLFDFVGKLQQTAITIVLVRVSYQSVNLIKGRPLTTTMKLLAWLSTSMFVAFATVGEVEASVAAEAEAVLTEPIAF